MSDLIRSKSEHAPVLTHISVQSVLLALVCATYSICDHHCMMQPTNNVMQPTNPDAKPNRKIFSLINTHLSSSLDINLPLLTYILLTPQHFWSTSTSQFCQQSESWRLLHLFPQHATLRHMQATKGDSRFWPGQTGKFAPRVSPLPGI